MGRALYSTVYAPVIREPSPSQYEKWSINKPFDPDSEEFFEGAQYEAFLPEPVPTSNTRNDRRRTGPRYFGHYPRRQQTGVVRATVSSDSNPMVLDSVPHDIPDQEPPFVPLSSSPRSLRDSNEDLEQSRPALSPMAGESDAEDPLRILASFMTTMRANGDHRSTLELTEILRQVDEEYQRQRDRPQRYLPPLDDSSSNSDSVSSGSGSPSSPIFFPSPPRSEALPSPPPMSREVNTDLHFPFDEDLERMERDLRDSNDVSSLAADELLPTPVAVSVSVSEVSDSGMTSIPIPSVPQTPPRTIYIHQSSPGRDVGLDMSPPPSVSPRLYNWARTGSESRPRFSSSSFTRRASYIPITEGRI